MVMNNFTHGLIFNHRCGGSLMAITANANSNCGDCSSGQRNADRRSCPTCLQSNLFQALIQLLTVADHAQFTINCIAFTDGTDPAFNLAAGKSRLACRPRKTLPGETAATALAVAACGSALAPAASRSTPVPA